MRQTESLNQEKPRLKRIFGNRKLQITGVLTLGLIVSCSAVAFVSSARYQPAPGFGTSVPGSQPKKQSLAQPLTKDKRGLHVIVFTLYDEGIEPAVLHTTKGLVAVSIEDHSGGTAGLVVEREIGNSTVGIGRIDRDQNHWRGRAELRLEPGRYRVFDSSRPANDAEIVVDP